MRLVDSATGCMFNYVRVYALSLYSYFLRENVGGQIFMGPNSPDLFQYCIPHFLWYIVHRIIVCICWESHWYVCIHWQNIWVFFEMFGHSSLRLCLNKSYTRLSFICLDISYTRGMFRHINDNLAYCMPRHIVYSIWSLLKEKSVSFTF